MKVLLFVQNEGDKRPKCWRCWSPGTLRTSASDPIDIFANDERWAIYLDRQDRWWLVECADAESGRAIIRAAVDAKGRAMRVASYVMCAKPGGGLTDGRIFATGGRS